MTVLKHFLVSLLLIKLLCSKFCLEKAVMLFATSEHCTYRRGRTFSISCSFCQEDFFPVKCGDVEVRLTIVDKLEVGA